MADVVPLTGENRVLVAQGLRGLDKVRNPGLRALLDVAGFTVGKAPPNARQVAFQLAPRMNAAGRMDTAKAVVEMFLTGDAARARELAQQLHDQNTERQQVELEVRETCEQIVVEPASARWCTTPENWHRGVLGIVASRLVERFHRPVFVLGRNADDGLASGSGRSIPAFHLLERAGIDAGAVCTFRRARARGRRDHGSGASRRVPAALQRVRRAAAFGGGFAAPGGDRCGAGTARDQRAAPSRSCSCWRRSATATSSRYSPRSNVEVAAPPVIMKEKHMRLTVRQNGRTLVLKAWNIAARARNWRPGRAWISRSRWRKTPIPPPAAIRGWPAILRDFRSR